MPLCSDDIAVLLAAFDPLHFISRHYIVATVSIYAEKTCTYNFNPRHYIVATATADFINCVAFDFNPRHYIVATLLLKSLYHILQISIHATT